MPPLGSAVLIVGGASRAVRLAAVALQRAGYEVLESADGPAAVRLVGDRDVAAVLYDSRHRPGGLEVLTAALADARREGALVDLAAPTSRERLRATLGLETPRELAARRGRARRRLQAAAWVTAVLGLAWLTATYLAPGGATLLYRAAGAGSVPQVRALLLLGAPVEAANNPRGGRPLHAAARGGHADVAALLLAHGAHVNSRSTHGATALCSAINSGSVPVVTLLLAHGADVNADADEGWTPLLLAIERRRWSLVQMLLAHGADVNAATAQGLTPLLAAARQGRPQLVRALLRRGAEDTIFAAAARGDLHRLRSLLAAGTSPDSRGARGATPLGIAACAGQLPAMALLLNHGASLDGGGAEPAPLVAAITCDRVAAVKFLLDHGADASGPPDSFGYRPLHLAAFHDNPEVAALLLGHGADVNATSGHGATPLYIAASRNCAPMALLLLARGADVNRPSRHNFTPLDVALWDGADEVAAVLREHGGQRGQGYRGERSPRRRLMPDYPWGAPH